MGATPVFAFSQPRLTHGGTEPDLARALHGLSPCDRARLSCTLQPYHATRAPWYAGETLLTHLRFILLSQKKTRL
jgi:hypothetical protein